MNANAIRLDELLDPKRLPLPDYPVVRKIVPVAGTDWYGDPAIHVMVLCVDATPLDHFKVKYMRPIGEVIKNALRKAGDDRWPFFRYSTEEAMREAREEVEAIEAAEE